MNVRTFVGTAALLGLCATSAVPADQPEASKDALKALNEFVGQWKGNGETNSGKSEIWKESAGWSWDLKGSDPALKLKVTGGKHFTEGTLRYLSDTKKYQ